MMEDQVGMDIVNSPATLPSERNQTTNIETLPNSESASNNGIQNVFPMVTKNKSNSTLVSVSKALVVGAHIDKADVPVYAQVRKKANTANEIVTFSISKEDSMRPDVEFPRHCVHRKIKFSEKFQRPTIEGTEAAIISELRLKRSRRKWRTSPSDITISH
jgi:hypothetical protein